MKVYFEWPIFAQILSFIGHKNIMHDVFGTYTIINL